MARVPAGVHASQMPLPQHERLRRPTGGIRVKQLGEGLTSSGRTVTAASGAAAAAAHASTGEGGPVPLYRRLFFPSNTAERPPRILATPGTEALDVQLYSLLALICRGFITPWYSKISRDRAFFLEIVRIASAVFRRIEAKLVVVPGVSSQNSGHGGEAQTAEVDEGRDGEAASDDNKPKTRAAGPPVDIVRLVFASLPRVLERHVRDYRRAEEEVASASAYGAGIRLPGHHANTHGSAPDASTVPISTLEVLFHSLQPHAAVASSPMFSPHLVETGEGAGSAEKLPPCMNAEYVRALVEALLKEFLPEKDYAAETERSVVREVIVGIILAGVFNKVAQPWFIYNLVVKALEQKPTHPLLERKTATETSREADQPWTARFGSVLANLPILFFRMTAVFASLSLLVTTSLASTRRPPACQQLVAAPIQLGFTFVRAGEGSRQVLDQLRWAALTGTFIASPVLDKWVQDQAQRPMWTRRP